MKPITDKEEQRSVCEHETNAQSVCESQTGIQQTSDYENELQRLADSGNLRDLPHLHPDGCRMHTPDGCLLNLSSNDYLGLGNRTDWHTEFLQSLKPEECLFSSTSSRLLTGNNPIYDEVEQLLANLYEREAALFFSSGYHMNTGILPALTDGRSLILADKLVHASIIDGIRLSSARCIRYRHQDYRQLEQLLEKHQHDYDRIFIVTESIFSMDGDIAPLPLLVDLKKRYPNVLLYVDEAHAVGARGTCGLGIAEEQGCLADIDLLCGTMGKALASMGAFVVCSHTLRRYLINKMRTLIFTTALPPIQMAWTRFVLLRLAELNDRRQHLLRMSRTVQQALTARGYSSPSESHILPVIIGDSHEAILKAEDMRRKGFYVLPVRPPTVPEGTSRLRLSLTASLTEADVERLIQAL